MIDIPPRPTMPAVSRVLYESTRYSVTLTRAGLIVQNSRTGTGVRLAPDHAQYTAWLDAFETALDSEESERLARALLS